MDKFPVIETERLLLRQKKDSDVPEIVKLAGDPSISDTTLSIPYPYYKKDAVYWINNSNKGFRNNSGYDFGIELKETGRFIGGIGLIIKSFDKAEAGFWIGKPYWNNGYCSEALQEIIKFGFDVLKLNKIFGHHFKENGASGKVMLKSRMIWEAEMKQHAKKNGRYIDIIQYMITREMYEADKFNNQK
jgi:ribosomal-protein-alanine N-acetyltransferase